MIKVCTASEKETVEIGRKLGMLFTGGEVIALNGELGAGKTAFTKGIALGLGISEYITSPTFALVNEYEGRVPLYHFDVYRISDEDELVEIGFEDYIYGNGVSVVEWSSLTPHIIPENRVEVIIEKISGDVEKRSIRFNFSGDKNKQLENKFTEEVLKYENSRS